MPNQPTPGQRCYEAFDAAFPADRFVRLAWHEQAPAVQAAWDAAAQGVLQWQAQQIPGTAGWLKAHPPRPLTDEARAALDATLDAFSEPEGEEAGSREEGRKARPSPPRPGSTGGTGPDAGGVAEA